MTAALTIPQLRRQADLHTKHTRGRKKPLDACQTCIATVAWFRSLPTPVLAEVLEDRGQAGNRIGGN